MADNIQAETVVTPGVTFATDDIVGIHHPKTKVEWGPSDTATQVDTGAAALPIQDGGNSITIDATSLPLPTGAATAAAQLPDGHNVTVDNAAGAAAVNIQDGGNSLTIDNATLSVVGGGLEATAQRVTIASDSTGVLSVDDNGGSLTVDGTITANAGTGNFNIVGTKSNNGGVPGTTNLGTIPAIATAAAPSYTEGNQVGLSVDLAGALRTAGGAGGTQYTEDAVAVADPVGTQPVMTRRDTPTALVSANLDVVSQQATNFGAAYVQVVNSSGAFVDTFGGSGGTAQADESAFTEGTTNMTPIGGVLNDTITSDPTEDQAAAVRITSKRAFHSNLRNVAGTEIGTATDPIRVDPTGTTVQPVSGIETFVDGGTGFTQETSRVAASGHIFDDTIGIVLTENDIAASRIDAKRAQVFVIEDSTTRNTKAGVSTGGGLKVNFRDNAGTEIGTAANPVRIDPTGTTTQPVSGTVNIGTFPDNEPFNVAQMNGVAVTMGNGASGTGVQRVTIADDSTGVVSIVPKTSNGLSMSHTVSAASTNATSLKASAGKVYSVQVFNLNAAARYFKLYNKASAPTVGTDTPVKVIMIPGNTAGAGAIACEWTNGIEFTTGIAWALTTGITNADATAVAANEILVEIDYK